MTVYVGCALPRTGFVRWMSESLRPFLVASDRWFLELMKTGRPGTYIPPPCTISRDVKEVFARSRYTLVKMLRVSVC